MPGKIAGEQCNGDKPNLLFPSRILNNMNLLLSSTLKHIFCMLCISITMVFHIFLDFFYILLCVLVFNLVTSFIIAYVKPFFLGSVGNFSL